MTQQSEADDMGDDTAEDVAANAIRKCRRNPPSQDKADQGRAFGMDPVLTQWPSLHPKEATPIEMRTDLARLQSAFPAFSFMICKGRRGPSYEAWRDTTRSGLYAIITDDPRELWHELDMAPR